jgi:hypothetical protein
LGSLEKLPSPPFPSYTMPTKQNMQYILKKEIESSLASNLLVAHSSNLLDFAQLFIIN